MTDTPEALPPLPEQLAATFIGYVEGLLGVCRVPPHVFEAFEQRADEFRAALAQAGPTLCHRNPAPNASQPMVPTPSLTVTIGAAQAEPQVPLDIAAIRAACRAEALEEAAQRVDRLRARESAATADHAGNWHEAYEHHLKRHAAMSEVLDAIREMK